MDWNDVRYFLALARLGSVRAAGASLGVSHSTVARRVEALESRLAARLFDRNRDGYVLTEAGRQMLPGAERIEHEMSALERGLVGQDERLAGNIAVTCCDNFVAALLLRELTALCRAYPDIELTFTSDSRSFDLSRREADIAIRTLPRNAQPPEHLIGSRLVPLVIANYVADEHASSLEPEQPGASPRWIAFEPHKQAEFLIATSSYPDVPAWGAFPSLELMAQAAREGLGLAMLPTYVGDPDPALRRLVHSDERHVADVWILSHPDLRDNARFRAARHHVASALKQHHDLFAGRTTDATLGPEITPSDDADRDVP